jgi:two-component system, NtrC family, sensor kinase
MLTNFRLNLSRWIAGQSLQTRFLSFSLLLTLLVLVVTQWLITLTSLRTVEATVGAEAAKAAARLGESLKQTSPTQPAAEFRKQALEILELVPHVARIDFYAKLNGELKLLDSTSSRGDRVLEGREAAAFYSNRPDTFLGTEKESHEIYSVQPVRFVNGEAGFVTVVSSVEAEQEMLHSHYRILLVALLAATALLGAATTWLFRTTVVDSIRQLVETMERFRLGERRVRVKPGLKAEFKALGKDLNYLLEEIGQFNQELEVKVQSATMELTARNLELHQLNAQLYETQKQLSHAERLALAGQLAATFAHEVGSPLSAISTQLQMLLEDPALEPGVRKRLQFTNEQIERICQIVGGQLSMVRRSSERALVNLHEIVKKVAYLLGPTFESRHIDFHIRADATPCRVEGNPAQLQQLFLNLINNSVDAISKDGCITVVLQRKVSPADGKPTMIEVSLSDTGIGIPPDQIAQVFEPFFTTKAASKGSGLGLVVCREIVAQHHGEIRVASSSQSGTCFQLLLPEASAPLRGHHWTDLQEVKLL